MLNWLFNHCTFYELLTIFRCWKITNLTSKINFPSHCNGKEVFLFEFDLLMYFIKTVKGLPTSSLIRSGELFIRNTVSLAMEYRRDVRETPLSLVASKVETHLLWSGRDVRFILFSTTVVSSLIVPWCSYWQLTE